MQTHTQLLARVLAIGPLLCHIIKTVRERDGHAIAYYAGQMFKKQQNVETTTASEEVGAGGDSAGEVRRRDYNDRELQSRHSRC
jgi:hypothetical protein